MAHAGYFYGESRNQKRIAIDESFVEILKACTTQTVNEYIYIYIYMENYRLSILAQVGIMYNIQIYGKFIESSAT